MKVSGRVFKYGDNIDTDVIIPARYLTSADPEHLKEHCMEDIDKSFKDRVRPGDIMVAGKNFGCGSSREHAPVAIKASADFDTGVITDKTTGESFNAKAFPEFIKNIMASGGLVGYTESLVEE